MKLVVRAPWRNTEDEAREDQKFLRNLFQLNHSFSLEGSARYDEDGNQNGKEWRAGATVETKDYIISGSQE